MLGDSSDTCNLVRGCSFFPQLIFNILIALSTSKDKDKNSSDRPKKTTDKAQNHPTGSIIKAVAPNFIIVEAPAIVEKSSMTMAIARIIMAPARARAPAVLNPHLFKGQHHAI
jgi:hypothetical protein